MSEILDIKFTDRATGKIMEGTIDFNHENGIQLMFVVKEPTPTEFDARFAAMTAMAEGIKAVVDGAEEFAKTGKAPNPTFEVIPVPQDKNNLMN